MATALPTIAPAPAQGTWSRLKAHLRAHPILCLALLTPGIPEYLSGSSSPVVLVTSPLLFALFLALNLGMYTGGVLLIREARVRWKLGLASVLVLGLAYGIAEEGLALTTLFDPNSSQVSPSTAGSWGGVNWGWTSGILPFHAVFSVALPLFLLDRVFPGLRDRSLVTGRAFVATAFLYLGTIFALGAGFALRGYWMGWPVLLGSLTAIGGLVLLARALPADALTLPTGRPTWSPRRFFVVGASVFPVLLLGPGVTSALHPPIGLLVLVAPALWSVYVLAVVPRLGSFEGGGASVALAAGLIAPLVVTGEFVGIWKGAIGLPMVFLVDALALGFLWSLYRRASGPVAGSFRPPSAAVSA